jgi:protocatechuate 3,4-dioxygenase beta subunit
MSKNLPNEIDIFGKIDSAFKSLDDQRAEGLKKLKNLQIIKDESLEIERQRLEKKYGADHPRVKKIASRITYTKGIVEDLDVEIEKTDIEVPNHTGTSWTVHGRVFDENANGIKDLTVSLFSDEGNWEKEFGFTTTDERGYFALTYSEGDQKIAYSLVEKKLYLTITDTEKNILHMELEPLTVEIGRMRYYEIVLTAKKRESQTPPEIDEEELEVGPDVWMAIGLVLDEEGQGISGLVVSLYDKDLLFDDILGTTLTDEMGDFKIIYRKEAFQDLFEKKPDLYIKVLDNQGNKLYSSRNAVKFQAGSVEKFTITIKKKFGKTDNAERKQKTDDNEKKEESEDSVE